MFNTILPRDLKKTLCGRTLNSAPRLGALRGSGPVSGKCTVYASALSSAEAPATPNLAEAS